MLYAVTPARACRCGFYFGFLGFTFRVAGGEKDPDPQPCPLPNPLPSPNRPGEITESLNKDVI